MSEPTALPSRFIDRSRALLAGRFRPAMLIFVAALAFAQVTRLSLFALRPQAFADGVGSVLAALAAGFVRDVATALWLATPWVLYLTLAPTRWLRTRLQRALMIACLAASLFGMLFVAAAEGFFFDEFESRFNFVAVDYLLYPTEVATNIWESYPTGTILSVLFLASVASAWALRRHLDRSWLEPVGRLSRTAFAAAALGTAALGSWLLPTGLAEVSRDRLLVEIAGNGYASFVRALLGADVRYDGFFLTRPADQVLARLPALLAEPGAPASSFVPGTSLRKIPASGTGRRLNVVVVLEESLGADFVGSLSSRQPSLTPELDALAPEGTLLTRAYSTGNRTIRAIEATTAGLPPLPGESLVRRPTSRGLFTLPGLLAEQGYETLFVYGGRALFDGMGRYLTANGVGTVIDQADFPDGTFTTAWGACDEAIFTRAIAEFDRLEQAGRPFYALVLSVSNHRPYDFPQDGIQKLPGLSRRENVVRYADYALGRFIRESRSHRFFSDTIFVLMGDHGARVYGAGEIPLPSYRVPILFFAPGIVPADQRLDVVASSLDVPPTVLGLLGHAYSSRFFGRDLFHDGDTVGRALLNHNHKVALLRGGQLAVLGLQRRAELFTVRSDQGEFEPIAAPDATANQLLEDAITYYQGGDLLYRTGRYQLDPVVAATTPADDLTGRPPG